MADARAGARSIASVRENRRFLKAIDQEWATLSNTRSCRDTWKLPNELLAFAGNRADGTMTRSARQGFALQLLQLRDAAARESEH